MRHGAEWQDIFAEQSPEDSDLWLDLIMYASVMNDDLAAIHYMLRNTVSKLELCSSLETLKYMR